MDFSQLEDILFQVKEDIAILTIHRPHVLNALRTKTKEEINFVLDRVENDPAIRGLLITGSGRAFVSGSDISEIGIGRPGQETAEMSDHTHRLLDKLAGLKKPTMAVINGYALGGGLELALACDLRVCGAAAKLGLPEIDLGVLPCYGGTQRLPRTIGVGLAKELLMTGRMMDAQEALGCGLVNRVYDQETLLQDAAAWMGEILRYSSTALYYAKVCVDSGMELSLADGLALESKVAGILVETPEAQKNVTAFIEKRKAARAAKAAGGKEHSHD